MVLSSCDIRLGDTSIDIDIVSESRLISRGADLPADGINVGGVDAPVAIDVAEKNPHGNIGAGECSTVGISHIINCDDDLLGIGNTGQVHRHRVSFNRWSAQDGANASRDPGAAH